MLLKVLLKQGTDCLKEHHIESASLEAQLLLCHLLKKNKAFLIAHDNDEIAQEQAAAFLELVKKRSSSYPLAYITGFKDFWSFSLKVNEHVLIPRSDTEILVEEALKLNPPPKTMLDLGTGSGAIILALKKELPSAAAYASDLSAEALEVAKDNAKRLNLYITFLQGAWFEALDRKALGGDALREAKPDKVPGGEPCKLSAVKQAGSVPLKFDLIVSNPPYIEESDPHLNKNGLNFEPQSALTSGADGLDDLRIIIKEAPRYLNSGGHLMAEHGYNQGLKVRKLFLNASFAEVKTVKDLGGNDRVTCGVWMG